MADDVKQAGSGAKPETQPTDAAQSSSAAAPGCTDKPLKKTKKPKGDGEFSMENPPEAPPKPTFDEIPGWSDAQVLDTLTETGEDWEKRLAAMEEISKRCIACVGKAGDAGEADAPNVARLEELLGVLMPKVCVQITDRRGQVVKGVCNSMISITEAIAADPKCAAVLSNHIADLIDHLLANVKVTIRVIAMFSGKCCQQIASLVPDTADFIILERLLVGCGDKGDKVRDGAIAAVRLRIEKFHPKDGADFPNDDLVKAITTCCNDGKATVRKSALHCLHSFSKADKDRATSIIDGLPSTIKTRYENDHVKTKKKKKSSKRGVVRSSMRDIRLKAKKKAAFAARKKSETSGVVSSEDQKSSDDAKSSEAVPKPGENGVQDMDTSASPQQPSKKHKQEKDDHVSRNEAAFAASARTQIVLESAVNDLHARESRSISVSSPFRHHNGTIPRTSSPRPSQLLSPSLQVTRLGGRSGASTPHQRNTLPRTFKISNISPPSLASSQKSSRSPTPTPVDPTDSTAENQSSRSSQPQNATTMSVQSPPSQSETTEASSLSSPTTTSERSEPNSSAESLENKPPVAIDSDGDVDMKDASPTKPQREPAEPTTPKSSKPKTPKSSQIHSPPSFAASPPPAKKAKKTDSASTSETGESQPSERTTRSPSPLPSVFLTIPSSSPAPSQPPPFKQRSLSFSPPSPRSRSGPTQRNPLWRTSAQRYERIRAIMCPLLDLREPRLSESMLDFLEEDFACAMLMEFLSRVPPDLQLDLLKGERTPKNSPKAQKRAISPARSDESTASSSQMPIDSDQQPNQQQSTNLGSPKLTKAALAAHAKALGTNAAQQSKTAPSISSLSVQRSDTPLSIPRTESMAVTEPVSVADAVPLEEHVPQDFAYIDEKSGKLRLRTWPKGEYPPASHVPGLKGRVDQSETDEMRWSNRLFFFLSPIHFEVHEEPHRTQFLQPEEHPPLIKFLKDKMQLIVLNVLACWCPGSAASQIHAADILKMLIHVCPHETFEALRHDSCAYLFQNVLTSCLHVPHAAEMLLDRGILLRPDDEVRARDMQLNAVRVRMFYDLCEWKILMRAAETACSPQVSDDVACAYVHFLRLFVTTMATQPHAELLLQDDINAITKSLVLTACDTSGKFSVNRRLVITEALTVIHKCLSTEVVKHTKFIVTDRLARDLPSVHYQTSLQESFCRNRFFSLLPKCLDAVVQTADSLFTSIMSAYVAQCKRSQSLDSQDSAKFLYFSLFKLMVALCTHHFPPKPEVAETEPDTDVSDSEAMDVTSDGEGNKENRSAAENGSGSNKANGVDKNGASKPKENGEEEIKETKEVIELLVKNTSTTLRHELTKAIPTDVHEILVKWLVEHSHSSIFAAALKELFDHIADTCPNDAFRSLLEESEVLEIMTSNYKITEENRTAFHSFVVAFGIMLLELSDPSLAPKEAEPKLDSESFDTLMSQRSESEELSPVDLDIDMVDALVKANKEHESEEGKDAISHAVEAVTPEKLHKKESEEKNESEAKGSTEKPAVEGGKKSAEHRSPSSSSRSEDGSSQPLIPWLAEFLKNSKLWQEFLPEIRNQYERQRTSIYPPLPPHAQRIVDQKRLAAIYGPSVPQFSGIDGMNDLERLAPEELLKRSKAIDAAKRMKQDEAHKREQKARLKVITGEITPEAYEILCRLNDLDDSSMVDPADDQYFVYEEEGEIF